MLVGYWEKVKIISYSHYFVNNIFYIYIVVFILAILAFIVCFSALNGEKKNKKSGKQSIY